MQRGNYAANTDVFLGILLGKTRRNRGHLRLRLFQAHAGFNSRDDFQVVVSATGSFFGVEGDRNPQLVPASGKLEASRHHANHGVAFAIQTQRSSDYAWIGPESPLP